MRAALLALVSLVCASGCEKKPPSPTRIDASSEPALLPSSPPSATIAPEPTDPDARYGKLATWTTVRIPDSRYTLKIPPDLLVVDEDLGALVLSSTLTVAPVGPPDPSKLPYGFRGRIALRKGSVVDCAREDKLDSFFPDSKKESFVEARNLARKLEIARRPSYMRRVLVHGFDASVYYVELEPKKTLGIRFETVGEALKSRVDPGSWRSEDWQLGLIDRILGTVTEGK